MLKRRFSAMAVVALIVVLAGCRTSVNSAIVVSDGETRNGGLSSVNGQIEVGSDCTIHGTCKTVNGAVRIGDNSTIEGAGTVNGSIRIGENVKVDGDVETVNGSISLDRGTSVSGEIQSVNGSIDLSGTRVDRDIRTLNGSIKLFDGSQVAGDIVIDSALGRSGRSSPVKIVISGSTVEGDVINENSRVEVRVYLRDGGTVAGKLEDVELIDENPS